MRIHCYENGPTHPTAAGKWNAEISGPWPATANPKETAPTRQEARDAVVKKLRVWYAMINTFLISLEKAGE